MFFVDTGTACIRVARHVKGGTNRRIFGSFSWASTANAAPNAFGAQLAYPGRQTIAVCGDGGFTMLGLGDLLTLVQRNAPVVQIILNNESLDFVNIEQQEAGIIPFGVDFKNPNFAKVAEAMGAKGIRIEEPGDVREGLAEALAHKGGPVVVDASKVCRLRILSADERMDFSYVAARKLDHGRIPLVGPIWTDKHSDAGCFSFGECISEISDLVPA